MKDPTPGSGHAHDEAIVSVGEFRLDLHLRSLHRGDVKVRITPKPFSALEYLVKNRHRVVSKAELLENVWGGLRESSTVEHAISALRRILEDGTAEARYIETVPGQGYRLIAEVEVPDRSASAPPSPNEDQVAVARRSHSRAWMSGLAVGAILLAGAGAVVLVRQLSRSPRIANVSLSRNSLAARNARGDVLWTYEFGAALTDRQPENAPWETQIVDLDGDGVPEVLVATGFARSAPGQSLDRLFCFSSGGKLLWSYRPQGRFQFGIWDLDGPWILRQVTVVPQAGAKTIYAAVSHYSWWPSFLVKISPTGAPKVVLVNSGNVRAITKVRTAAGDYILASGINNEYRQAFLAILAEGGSPTTSPQAQESRYQCVRGCPAARPYRYILFPRSELSEANDEPYNIATGIYSQPAGVTVHTDEVPPAGFEEYDFSPELLPERVSWGDRWGQIHKLLESRGRIKHSLEHCPELKAPAILKVCDQNGNWSTVSVPRRPWPY